MELDWFLGLSCLNLTLKIRKAKNQKNLASNFTGKAADIDCCVTWASVLPFIQKPTMMIFYTKLQRCASAHACSSFALWLSDATCLYLPVPNIGRRGDKRVNLAHAARRGEPGNNNCVEWSVFNAINCKVLMGAAAHTDGCRLWWGLRDGRHAVCLTQSSTWTSVSTVRTVALQSSPRPLHLDLFCFFALNIR